MVAESIIMNEYEKTMDVLFKNKLQNKNKYLNVEKCCLKILKILVLLLILNFGVFIGYFTHNFIERKSKISSKINNNYEKIMRLEQLLNSIEKKNIKKTDFENDINKKIIKLKDNKDLENDTLKSKTIDDLYEECQVVENIHNIFQNEKCYSDYMAKVTLKRAERLKKLKIIKSNFDFHSFDFGSYDRYIMEQVLDITGKRCMSKYRCSFLKFGHNSDNFKKYIKEMKNVLNNNFELLGIQHKNT